MTNYLKKGKLIAASGRIETRTYEGNDGQKKYYTDVVIEDFQFLEKKDDTGSGPSRPMPGSIPNYGGQDDGFYPVYGGDNDTPF